MAPPESIWQDEPALAAYYASRPIPETFEPGIVAASVLVSILGSYATLLLLGKRTSIRGTRNLVLLLAASVTFGVVGVWSMHFVSMLGLRLVPSPTVDWYLRFSPGFTALSLFAPLVAFALAFIFLGSQAEFSIWRVVLTGVAVGGTIALMHYSASFSLPLFMPIYSSYTVVLAILEACLAATAALFVFFRYRSHWEDSFIKRGLSSLVLAAAVLGMHHIALAGTTWTFRMERDLNVEMLHRRKTQSTRLTIAIAVMCLVIIVLSIALAVSDLLVKRKTRKDSRQIVVASAAFDKFGRVLVKLNGSLPFQVIETEVVVKDMLNELDPRRPTFQWLFCLSFDWSIITAFLPLIAQSILDRRANPKSSKLSPSSSNPSAPTTKSFYGRNGTRSAAAKAKAKQADNLRAFKARFIEATYELAQELDIALEDVGVMFDQTLLTGTIGIAPGSKEQSVEKGGEEGEVVKEEGIMLVVVRELSDERSVEQYLARGYRFAETRHFSGVFSDRVGVPRQEMDLFLGGCKTFAKRGTRPVVQPGGAYVGLFGVRPTGNEASAIEILSYAFAKHQIPAYRLPDVVCPLIPEARNFLRSLSGLTMAEVLVRCDDEISRPIERPHRRSTSVRSRSSRQSKQWSDDESGYDDWDEEASPLLDFQIALSIAIEALSVAMVGPWPNINEIARLSPEILNVPSSEGFEPAQLIVLEVVLPKTIYGPSKALGKEEAEVQDISSVRGKQATIVDEPPAPFTFTPFSLFSSAQTMMIRGQGAEAFSREVTVQLCSDYGVEPPAHVQPSTSSHPYSSTQALNNPPSHEFTAITSHSKSNSFKDKLPASQSSRNFSLPIQPSQSQSQRTSSEQRPQPLERRSSLPSNSDTALPLANAPVPTSNTASTAYQPTVPRRSASLRAAESNGSLGGKGPTGAMSSQDSIMAGTNGAPRGMAGRVAVGGTDGWYIRTMRDLELSPQGPELSGVQW
ncbi:hypothetical protein BDY24DRAFT_110596 [Mrakia frigida]|uniref:MHYT domain-containing protein n=1 Tax=Mrakia frigida TaxID=29902 RepID=UPI003FCC099B